jgi:hypothetical protein
MKLTISFSASMGITVLPFNNYGKEIFNLWKKEKHNFKFTLPYESAVKKSAEIL